MTPEQRGALANDFKKAMRAARRIFGRQAFRKLRSGRVNPISKPLFEAWGVQLARCSSDQIDRLVEQRADILNRFVTLLNQDPEFDKAISLSTSIPQRIRTRFATIRDWCRSSSDAAANRAEELQVLRGAGSALRAAELAVRPERHGQEQRHSGAAGPAAVVPDRRPAGRAARARRRLDRSRRRLGRVVRGRRGGSHRLRIAAGRDARALGAGVRLFADRRSALGGRPRGPGRSSPALARVPAVRRPLPLRPGGTGRPPQVLSVVRDAGPPRRPGDSRRVRLEFPERAPERHPPARRSPLRQRSGAPAGRRRRPLAAGRQPRRPSARSRPRATG